MINLNRMDLVSLRLFAAVVDAGSLTAGAQRFGLSLAAASKRMVELESQLGNRLLLRGKAGVSPTPAGQALHRQVVELVSRLEQLALVMGDFEQGARGHLRLWANVTAYAGFLPGLLARFAAEHPGVRLELEDASSEEAARAVASGVAELAIIGENTPVQGLHTEVIDQDELVLVLPAGHALAGLAAVPLALALEHDFVGFGRSTSLTRQLTAAAEALGRPYSIRAQVRSMDVMCRMVAAGLGLAILPRSGVAPLASTFGLQVLALDGAVARRQLLLACQARDSLSGPAHSFVQMLVQRHRNAGPG